MDPSGEEGQGFLIGDIEPGFLDQLTENGQSGSEIGCLEGHGESPFEAVTEAVRECRDFRRGAVCGENDLASGVMKSIEGVEELFFGAGLSSNELDVIYEQNVQVAVAAFESVGSLFAQGGDELGCEGFRVGVEDIQFRDVRGQIVGDSTEKMSFPETGGTVEEEGVVCLGRGFGYRESGSMCQVIAGPDNESIEVVGGIRAGLPGRGFDRLRLGWEFECE